MRDPKKAKRKPLDPDAFLASAATAAVDGTAEKPTPREPRPRSTNSRMPAIGTKRTSFDLPEAIHLRLKVAAAKEGRSMQEIVVGLLEDNLASV